MKPTDIPRPAPTEFDDSMVMFNQGKAPPHVEKCVVTREIVCLTIQQNGESIVFTLKNTCQGLDHSMVRHQTGLRAPRPGKGPCTPGDSEMLNLTPRMSFSSSCEAEFQVWSHPNMSLFVINCEYLLLIAFFPRNCVWLCVRGGWITILPTTVLLLLSSCSGNTQYQAVRLYESIFLSALNESRPNLDFLEMAVTT